ncbi:unnamed protein product [Rhizoctonia solani]|uniref:Uncharacterized protein n=1 Tax=Rhizoctonia solani TaxID=456999 RepID=A0A8H2ZYJ8_9AGAM|nr:unnamed protein product [Rhizoctonia solani]
MSNVAQAVDAVRPSDPDPDGLNLDSLWRTSITTFHSATRYLGDSSLPGLDTSVLGSIIECINDASPFKGSPL